MNSEMLLGIIRKNMRDGYSICLPCYRIPETRYGVFKESMDKIFGNEYTTYWSKTKHGVLVFKKKTKQTMINEHTVAEALYTEYCKAVGGKAFNGDPLPSWEEFSKDETKKKQSDAWLAAAARAMQLLLP